MKYYLLRKKPAKVPDSNKQLSDKLGVVQGGFVYNHRPSSSSVMNNLLFLPDNCAILRLIYLISNSSRNPEAEVLWL